MGAVQNTVTLSLFLGTDASKLLGHVPPKGACESEVETTFNPPQLERSGAVCKSRKGEHASVILSLRQQAGLGQHCIAY